jgi:hypothetical protein
MGGVKGSMKRIERRVDLSSRIICRIETSVLSLASMLALNGEASSHRILGFPAMF